MFASRPTVANAIKRYTEELIALGINVERVYLYGSHARGTAHGLSDVDVIIVASDFAEVPRWRRPEITGAARRAAFELTGESVAGLMKTPDEITNCHPASFLADVLKDAIVVYECEAVKTVATQ